MKSVQINATIPFYTLCYLSLLQFWVCQTTHLSSFSFLKRWCTFGVQYMVYLLEQRSPNPGCGSYPALQRVLSGPPGPQPLRSKNSSKNAVSPVSRYLSICDLTFGRCLTLSCKPRPRSLSHSRRPKQ